jgi:hypothetical protein
MISLKSVRRAGVPLVAIETSDMQQTIQTILVELNGKKKEVPILRWDICRGLVSLNDAGKTALSILSENPTQETIQPYDCLMRLEKFDSNGVIFFENAHLYWKDQGCQPVVQGIWNLRDTFKRVGATLVLLCSHCSLPMELKNDIITLTDTLPTLKEVETIVDSVLTDAKIEGLQEKEKINEILLGLSAFAGEQALAMSVIAEKGKAPTVDREALWETKRRMIEQTPGLSVWRGQESFNDICGYDNVKEFMLNICQGNNPPQSIIFIDEINFSVS